ncbi:MAG: hypothetical protein GVY08_01590 [Bacteroidetes bacterium]|jgi:hypothetical protein|nr:hypothetical protein [Bacteroidota bacterium]
MIKELTALLLLHVFVFPGLNSAAGQQMVLNERFEDGNLTEAPVWTGDLDDFTFVRENGNTLLRLEAEEDPSRTQIRTLSSVTTGSWEFFFRQEFKPSNLNRAFFFLMADQQDLNYLDGSKVNGYAVRTGDNQSPRRLKLVRFDGGDQTVLAESGTVIEEGVGYRVKVTRSADGEWRLYIGEGITSDPVQDAEAVTDIRYTSSTYFGLLLRYSSGNVSNFYFDDFIINNSEPFQLTEAAVTSADQVTLRFNYPLDPESITPASADFPGMPDVVEAAPGPSRFEALYTLSDIIDDGEYTITAGGIRSAFGNQLPPGSAVTISFENPFFVVRAEGAGPRRIVITFSRPLSDSSLQPRHFTVNGSIRPISAEQVDPGEVALTFASDLPTGVLSLVLDNLESEQGWRIRSGTELTVLWFEEAEAGDVVINEILYRRAAAGEPQFVEVRNNRGSAIDLSGWSLATGRGSATIGDGVVLRENGFLVFTDSEEFAAGDQKMVLLPGFRSLRTTGDAVLLRTAGGSIIDSLSYSPEWGGSTPGRSLEKKDPLAISIDPSQWGASLAESGSTPLERNSRYQPDETPPGLLYAGYLSSQGRVVARFNEFVQPDPATQFRVDGEPVRPVAGEVDPGAELFFETGDLPGDRNMLISIENLSDYQGNRSGLQEIPVARPPAPGSLVFNEVMFDPLRDDFDDLPNQTEYLEIINLERYAVSLEGLHLHDRPDESGDVSQMHPVESKSKWIPAGNYAILQAADGIFEFDESGNSRFFGLDRTFEPHVLQFDRATLSLSLSGREVYLADSLGQAVDMVAYDPGWHNPNLVDTKGISLERINPRGESNHSNNWGSSAAAAGGTPGADNSILQLPGEPADAGSVSLEPNPFSPDGDGHEDRLMINYSFMDPDFLLRVRIFDRYGRLIVNLADSHPAGLNGTLTWDGRMENGVTGRIGIYIIHIEAYNSTTGERRTFKETAVIARKF